MSRRRGPVWTIPLLALVLALSGCAGASTPDTEDGHPAVTLSLGHAWSPDDRNAQAVAAFADQVRRESGGTVEIEVYPSGQLGGDAQMLEGLGLGTVDMWVGGSGVYSQMTPAGQFLVLPYLFEDLRDAMSRYDRGLAEAVAQQIAADTRTRVLSFWPRGPRHLTLNHPARTPQDIADERIRVPENPMILRTWNALGASPTPMPFGDTPTALEQGMLDGQENPLETISSAGLAAAQSTLVLTGHVIEPTAVSIGDAAWDRLDPAQRKLLSTASNGATRDELLSSILTREQVLRDELAAEGMTIVEPDRAAFAAQVAGLGSRSGPAVAALRARAVAP